MRAGTGRWLEKLAGIRQEIIKTTRRQGLKSQVNDDLHDCPACERELVHLKDGKETVTQLRKGARHDCIFLDYIEGIAPAL